MLLRPASTLEMYGCETPASPASSYLCTARTAAQFRRDLTSSQAALRTAGQLWPSRRRSHCGLRPYWSRLWLCLVIWREDHMHPVGYLGAFPDLEGNSHGSAIVDDRPGVW